MSIILVVIGFSAPISAATRTSTATGGTWATGSTWVGGTAPKTGDNAIIATTGTNKVTLGANTTCVNVTVNTGSILTIAARTLTLSGSINNSGTISMTTGRISQSGNTNITNSGTINITTGRILHSGTGNFTNSGTVAFTGTGVMTFVGSFFNTGTFTLLATPVTFSGTNATASTVDGFTTTGQVTYSRTAGSTTLLGDVSAAAFTLTATGGTLNMGASLNHTFSGRVTLTRGTLNCGSSTINANLVGTAWTNTAGVFNAQTGTVILGGTGNQTLTGTLTTTFNNFTLKVSGTKTLTKVPVVNGILSMEGTATCSSTPTFGAASTIQYKGTTSRTTSVEFPAAFAGTGGLIVDQGVGNTISLNANKTGFNGNLNVVSGTLDLLSYDLNRVGAGGSLTLSAGTTLKIGGANALPSNFSSYSLDVGSTVLFNGSSTQSIGGLASTTFGNLTLDNPLDVALDYDQTVNGVLNLTNGLLNTGSNTLTIGCTGSISNANASRYVNGKLANVYCNPGTKIFPIGKGGNYRPLSLTYSNLTGSSTVTAEQIEGTLPGSLPDDITPFASRYWAISQSGGSSYTFLLSLDGTGWTPTSYLKMLKGDGSTNSHFGVTTPNYSNSTAFNSFGNFGLGELNYVTWLGLSTDWFSPSNWTCESVPVSTDETHIPSSMTFYPSISGSSPSNDFSIASSGILQIEDGASISLENGPLLTFDAGATVTTGVGAKIILKSDARYLNLCSSTPTLEVQRELTDSAGWRMLSSPVNTAFDDMFKAPLVTQGFTGSSFSSLAPNLLWWDETDGGTSLQSWRMPSALSDNLVAGRGYFHYAFNGAGRLNDDGNPSGSNYSDALPTTISVTGVSNYNGIGTFDYNLTYTAKASTQAPSPTDTIYYDLNALDEGWNLIGNPTASTLDWDAVGWTKTNVDNSIYVWDPSALGGNGDFLTWNGTIGTLGNGKITPFQAFWVHTTSATTLSFTNAVKTGSSGTFLRSAEREAALAIPITLTVGSLQTTSYLSFSDNGVTGPDNRDAYRLESMSDTWLDLYTTSSPRFVSPLVTNHLPLLNNELTHIPLYCNAQMEGAGSHSEYTLSWELPENWPSDWKISLQDHQSEQAISMKERTSYSFNAALSNNVSVQSNMKALPQKPLRSLSETSLLRSTSLPPFSILISKGADIDYMAPKPQLLGNYPNPFGKMTNIRFSLPQKAQVKIEVYSSRGRRFALLAEGVYPTGITEIPWNTNHISPGIYFIRFSSGETMETKKAVLIY